MRMPDHNVKCAIYAFTYKVFRNVGHSGLIAEHREQFIEEVKAVHASSPKSRKYKKATGNIWWRGIIKR